MSKDLTTELTIDAGQVRSTLTGFIRSEIASAGFSHAVIGLSGGIDSVLACYLAAEALGPQNVLAIRMPYRDSSQESLDHAQMTIEATGVQAMTVEITPMVEPLFQLYPDISDLRKGNIMARQRMIILYDQSVVFNGLVVGTGNKTEILLGYATLFGDSACAFNPIGDLYKTQVRQLARALGIPEVIVGKAPSADLWAGQTDEGELGFTYAEVDKLLFLLVDKRYSPQQCIEAGFAEPFVHTVIQRIRRSQFKRTPPPIGKLNGPAAGYGFPELPDWGA
ncbi:MAG: NAD+ synthase [Anaerolineaceae bacterium]|nr:NAD+ synthase [Anaerolineaceae bacterium]